MRSETHAGCEVVAQLLLVVPHMKLFQVNLPPTLCNYLFYRVLGPEVFKSQVTTDEMASLIYKEYDRYSFK